MSRVVLTIAELVLHGFDAGARHSVADAMQAELARLFGAGALPSAWSESLTRNEIRARAAAVSPSAPPAEAGRAIAVAVHGALAAPPGQGGGA